MHVLLDECLPKKLKREFHEHTVVTVQEQGWMGKKNGELLRLALRQFDVFITVDQNLSYQQNLSITTMSIVVLIASNNRFETIKPLMPKVLTTLKNIRPESKVQVS